MLTTELSSATTLTSSTTGATSAKNSANMLRLHGGTEDDRLIPIPVGKSSIGSGPRCSVRLVYDGVRPLHCLITRDDRGLHVRRWADGVELNGVPFDEAGLAPGDRLMIGSVELEVVGELEAVAAAEDDAATTSATVSPSPMSETDATLDAVQNSVSEMIGDSGESSPQPSVSPVDLAPSPAAATSADPAESVTPNRLTRTRRRRLLAELRFLHQMGIQLERAVTSLEQQMRDVSAGQATSTAQTAHLTDTLATLVDQVHLYRRGQTELEQRHADWLERSRGWESRLEEQQQRLQGFECGAERSRAFGDSLHRRGRKLVASLRKGRDSFRSLDERLASLELRSQESCTERERLRDELAKAIEQLSAQETQSVAWNTVVEATDRLSNNYKQLSAENARLASEIENYAAARGELAAEKAAAAEMLAMLREQYQENQQRQTEFDFQRGQWRDELRAWEKRVIERDEWADRFERELNGIRTSFDVPTVPIADWKSLAEQVASLTSQQSESTRQRGAWESRVAECETRLADGGEQLGAVRHEVQLLRAEAIEQAGRTTDSTGLAAEVASLASQLAEWENERGAVRGRVDDCEARLAERVAQLSEFERQMAELQTACQQNSTQATGWTTLTKQVATLQDQQSEWEQRRSAWQGRIEQCETRLADLGRQLTAFEQTADAPKTAASELPNDSAEWTALSEQVATLRDQQTEWEKRRDVWQSRVEACESQFGKLRQHIDDTEQSMAALQTAHSEPTIPADAWTALTEQVAALRTEQADLAQQRAAWDARLREWETQLASSSQQFGDLASEVERLGSAHHDQATQVTELSSLFEQLAALQGQQVEFDHLRTEWQDRVSEWESQLQQRLHQFESFERTLQQLQATQREQADLVVQLASQGRVRPQSDEPAQPSAVVCEPSEHGSAAPASADQAPDSNDVAEQPTLSSATVSSATDEMGPVDEEAMAEPAVEAEPVEAESVVESEPVETAAPAPVSYLEKYAHIFEEDHAEEPSDSSRLTVPLHANRNEIIQPEPTAEEQPASHGDEESVEQYMAKLMTRIRGDSRGHTASSDSATVETDKYEMPAATTFAVDAAEPVAASPNDAGSTVAIVDEATNSSLLNDLEEMKPRTPAPAFAADMQALRSLANQSARHAIGIHTAHRLRRTATTRCVIAVLAVLSGVYLFVYAPGWRSLQFASACVAMLAGLYWTKLSVGSLIQAIRLGAFQNFDDDEDPVHPPLPIDVDPSHDEGERVPR